MDNDDIEALAGASNISSVAPQMSEDDEKELKKAEAEIVELRQLAKSPAWKKCRKTFQEQIEKIEKLDYLDLNASAEKIAIEVKTAKQTASWLRAFMEKIDSSVEGVENE